MVVIFISNQLSPQRRIFKINSRRLRNAKWNLSLSLHEARKNGELVAFSDSQILRWLDELNGVDGSFENTRRIQMDIRALRREPNEIKNKRRIAELYNELERLEFKEDYVCIVIDKNSDYTRACKGFTINGLKYHRLLGTSGGIKNKTIVFIADRHGDEIRRRIENGRNQAIEMVPAKLEAYKALTCSGSTPVSLPSGVIVVKDCETKFLADVVYLDDEGVDEPSMEFRPNTEIAMNASDGFGLMLPSLAERWASDLQLGYTPSGVNTRFAFEKGMVFTFDFIDFAEKIAGKYEIIDAWGDTRDVRDAEIILTTSMVKLWDSYSSCEEYMSKSIENGYTFGVPKACPKELEHSRGLNYQFIQSYDLSDEDIAELIKPTIDEIRDVLGRDWRKTLLFLCGKNLSPDTINFNRDMSLASAIMAEPLMINDPHIQNHVYKMIQKRIDRAKIGVIDVHGNYSIISGDPYALCQSMFGMDATGLLKAGEIYNKYWSDYGSEELACFRAPMSTHSNIRRVRVHRSDDAAYWFKYMTTCTILNAWDTITMATNGADFDGDIFMLTDNRVLVNNLRDLPALMCVQRKAQKKIVTEEDFIAANIASFGNEIGRITNHITSMFDVRSRFPKDSEEYKVLDYRIQCGQLGQQNQIDKSKGIVAKQMPREWFDYHAASAITDPDKRALYLRILADKKPYFMQYVYTNLRRDYRNFEKATNKKALMRFQCTTESLLDKPLEDLSQDELEFVTYYNKLMPVSNDPSVMNRICWTVESAFDKKQERTRLVDDFDYTIMKSESEYSRSQYYAVKKIVNEYNADLSADMARSRRESVRNDDYDYDRLSVVGFGCREQCDAICSNSETLCNIVLDMCYGKKSSKSFVWQAFMSDVIENLLKKHDYMISIPVRDGNGDIFFGGDRFSMVEVHIDKNELWRLS